MTALKVGDPVRINFGQFYGQVGVYRGPDPESQSGRECVLLSGRCAAFGVQSFPAHYVLPLTANNGD